MDEKRSFVVEHISTTIAATTMLIIFGEGMDIMLRRIRETLRREKEIAAAARAEGKAEVYREIAEWEHRRREAESRGENFTEPPPTQPQNPEQ